MKKWSFIPMTVFIALGTTVQSQETAPLKLVQTVTMPPDVKGHFDHFEVDVKGNRLFATPESCKAVLVFDLKPGKPVHTMSGIEKPHAVLYREDLNRIDVTDGEAGDLKIFDGKTYTLLSSVKLLEDADSMAYDPTTKYLTSTTAAVMSTRHTPCSAL
jgi:DNA-binding beta-propeller fold protein YncE